MLVCTSVAPHSVSMRGRGLFMDALRISACFGSRELFLCSALASWQSVGVVVDGCYLGGTRAFWQCVWVWREGLWWRPTFLLEEWRHLSWGGFCHFWREWRDQAPARILGKRCDADTGCGGGRTHGGQGRRQNRCTDPSQVRPVRVFHCSALARYD
jgi:hypothetical protein